MIYDAVSGQGTASICSENGWVSPPKNKKEKDRGKREGQEQGSTLADFWPAICEGLKTPRVRWTGPLCACFLISHKSPDFTCFCVCTVAPGCIQKFCFIGAILTWSPERIWQHMLHNSMHHCLWIWSKICCCCCLVAKSCPTVLWPRELQPARLLCLWDFPGKNTGVCCHFLLQGILPTQGPNSCLLHWQGDSLTLNHQESSCSKIPLH